MSETKTIDWFGKKVDKPTKYMLKYLEDQKLPIVEGCEYANNSNYSKYLIAQYGYRGCWKCKACLQLRELNVQRTKSFKDLNPYWDENNCCSVNIRGQKRPLPVKFLKYISEAKGISEENLKSIMVKH